MTTFTNPTIYDVRRDLVSLPKLPHILCSHLISSFKFFGQPDDGLHTGPKHVVVYNILLLTVILLCSWLYVYIDIYTPQLCTRIIDLTQRGWCTLRLRKIRGLTHEHVLCRFVLIYRWILEWKVSCNAVEKIKTDFVSSTLFLKCCHLNQRQLSQMGHAWFNIINTAPHISHIDPICIPGV